MENNENKESVTETQKTKGGIKRILNYIQYPVIAIIIIGVLYLVINPEPLKKGKKLAKEGDYTGAISEFANGLDDYYNNNLPGGRRGRRLVQMGYKMNLHNFYYNMALSYEALAKIAEEENNLEDALVYYAYTIEAYDSVLLEKEKHKQSIEAIEIANDKFEELYGSPYIMGTLFGDDEEVDSSTPVTTTTLSEEQIKQVVVQQITAAQTFVESGDYEIAVAQYNVGLHYATNNIELHELKLVALYELKDYKEAKKSIKTILKLDKNNATAKKYKDLIK